MRTITIEINEGKGFTVRDGDRYHDELCWDEMLGQITELTHPKLGEARYQMLTAEGWAQYNKRFERTPERAPDDAPTLLLTHHQEHHHHE